MRPPVPTPVSLDRAARREALEQATGEWKRRIRRHTSIMWGLSTLALGVGAYGGVVDWRPGLSVTGALAMTVVGWSTSIDWTYPLATQAVALRERLALMAVALLGFGLGLVGSMA